MTDRTPEFNTALSSRNASPVVPHRYSVDDLDSFIKEAYSINARIADLTNYLRAVRPSYLSTAPAARQRHEGTGAKASAQRHLTDKERTAIDAEAKSVLQQLHTAVTGLATAEGIRQETVTNVAMRKRKKNELGAWGRWATGGTIAVKTLEEQQQEDAEQSINLHREGVIWYLQRKLEQCGSVQSDMMEIRIQREVEKSKSVLFKSKTSNIPYETFEGHTPDAGRGSGATRGTAPEENLSEEQMQLFAEENDNMLKHYEDTLEQVRNTEKSVLEIHELQTTLAANLSMQSANIDQLVQDSFSTTENVDKGNVQLKKASERTSTARLLFHGTCAFCAFLVVWDVVF